MPIGRIGQDFIVNTTTADGQTRPSITALADGRFVVTWDSFDNGDGSEACIRGRIYNADGSAGGSDFILNTTTAGSEGDPSVTALADGRFVVTWNASDNGSDIRGRVYNANGSADTTINGGNDFLVNTTTANSQFTPSVTALADGRFVVTWTSLDNGTDYDVRGRVYNANGSPAGNDFLVNTVTANSQQNPSVAALADGRFIVTWQSSDNGLEYADIRGRVYNANGSPAGGDFLVNTTTANGQFTPSVTALADGRFVVTWESYNGADSDVRGRVYNANGSPAGNDFLVNTVTASDQGFTSVTALADGRFVVTWQSTDNGVDFDIRGRLYNADGSAAGDDFQINTTTAFTQVGPSVTALADGRFVVTWESYDNGSDPDIRAQIFDPTVFNGTASEDLWQGSNIFADRITGGAGNDTLSGLGGDDLINGDAGNDILNGGAGNDRLFGGADNDTLNGGTGADQIAGGSGDDKYYVDNAGDSIIETAGGGTADRVYASVSYQLAAGAEVEILNTSSNGGTAAINLAGNSFANTIIGNAGNNIINGLGGIDTMHGLGGNDRYYVDNAADVIVEAAGGGTADQVLTSVDYSLKSGVDVELLTTTNAAGTAALKLAGNSYANTVIANAGNNLLNGSTGADTLTGLGGSDIFMFNTALAGGNIDDVTDFSVADDTIRLENSIFTAIAGTGTLTAAQFVKNTSGTAQDASDRIIYETDTGRLIYDTNGSTAGGRYLFATLDAGLALTNADFFIV
jgi:Ca2+-binding RTX toxin-like protein